MFTKCKCAIVLCIMLGIPELLFGQILDSVGTEFPLSISKIYDPTNDGVYASVAFDGTNYFTIWRDSRETFSRPIMGTAKMISVWGTRVNPDGHIIDSIGIQVHRNVLYWDEGPNVAYDGTNYLVVWSEWIDNSNQSDVFGKRVSPEGVVLDSTPITICSAQNYQYNVQLSSGDGVFLVVWEDSRNGGKDIYGARVTSSGDVLDPDGISISIDVSGQLLPAVSFDGTHWLTVWEDVRNGGKTIFGARVDTTGVVLDPTGINISQTNAECRYTCVFFNSTDYLVCWQDERIGTKDIYGARVDTAGTVLDPAGIQICGASGDQWRPALHPDNTNWFVVWQDARGGDYDIYGTRVSLAGVVLDPGGIIIFSAPDYQGCPAITYGAPNFLVAWHEIGGTDIRATRVDTTGTVLDPAGISLPLSTQRHLAPDISYDGVNYLSAWSKIQEGSYDIYGSRINSAGVILDTNEILISSASGNQLYPALSFNGTNYLVVWQDSRNGNNDIYGTRIDPDGVVLDPGGIQITTNSWDQDGPAVCWNGSNWLIAWHDYRTGGGNRNIYGARVDQAGTVLDPSGFPISTEPNTVQWVPAISFDGTNNLVVWVDNRNSDADIYGARVTPSGTVLDPTGIQIAGDTEYNRMPSLDFDGTNYLVSWESQPFGGGDANIWSTRVNPAGSVFPTVQVTINTDVQLGPSTVFNGTNYLVAWYDYRFRPDIVIKGAWINIDGAIIDTFDISVVLNRWQALPALCHGNTDKILCVYNGFLTSEYGSMRAVARVIRGAIGIDEIKGKIADTKYGLQVHPNPFREITNLKFQIPSTKSQISLEIYDVSGRVVKEFILPTAYSSVSTIVCWHGRDNSSKQLPSGVYLVRLESDDFSVNKKIIKLK